MVQQNFNLIENKNFTNKKITSNGLFSIKFTQHLSVFTNITKACIGAGILEFPYLFQQYGYLGALLYTFLFGFISYSGCVLYIVVNAYIKDKLNSLSETERIKKGYPSKTSLSTMSLFILPKFKLIIDFIVIFKCLFVSLGYFALIAETLKTIVEEAGCYEKSSNLFNLQGMVICIFLSVYLLTTPFICAKKIDTLKRSSFLGLIGVMMLLGVTVYYKMTIVPAVVHNVKPFNEFNILHDLGSFVFSYTCHQNIVAVQNEADQLDSTKMNINVGVVYIFTTFIYITFGFLNYQTFNHLNINKKIFDTWPEGKVKLAILSIYVAFLSVTIPLHVHPIKTMIADVFGINNVWAIRGIGLGVTTTWFILAVFKLITFLTVSKYVSQTFSALLVFIIPASNYILYDGRKRSWGYILCSLCIINGILCFIKTIMDLTIWNK